MSVPVKPGQIWKDTGMQEVYQYRITRIEPKDDGTYFAHGKLTSRSGVEESEERRFGALTKDMLPKDWASSWHMVGTSQKVEVGQLLIDPRSRTTAYRITKIVGNDTYAVRIDPTTRQDLPGYTETPFGNIRADGTADWMKGWDQMSPGVPVVSTSAKGVVIKEGMLLKNRFSGDIWRITEIYNNHAAGNKIDSITGKIIVRGSFGHLNGDHTAPSWGNDWEVLPAGSIPNPEPEQIQYKPGTRVKWANTGTPPPGTSEWIGTVIEEKNGYARVRFDGYKYMSNDYHNLSLKSDPKVSKLSEPILASTYPMGEVVEVLHIDGSNLKTLKARNFTNKKVVLEDGAVVEVGGQYHIARRLEPAPAVSVGDKVLVTVPRGSTSTNLTGTYVGNNTVYLDKKYSQDGASSHRTSTISTKEAIQKLGLDPNQDNCWLINSDSFVSAITERAADVAARKALEEAKIAEAIKLAEELATTKAQLKLAEEGAKALSQVLDVMRANEANRVAREQQQIDDLFNLMNEDIEEENEPEEETMAVEISEVGKGDVVEVEFMDKDGNNFVVEGTVIKYMDTDQGPRTFIMMDEEVDLPGTGWKTKYLSDCPKEVQKAARDLGFDDDNGMCVLRAKDGAQYAKITSVLERAPAEIKKTETRKEQKHMSTEQGLGEMLKGNFKEAAWRTGATQMSNAVQAGILMMLKDKGMEEGKVAAIKEFLNSEIGNAFIRGAIGVGLLYAPGLNEDPRVQKLSEEMRISGMSKVGDEVIGAAFQYLLPAVQGVIQALPPVEQAAPAGVRKAIEASGVKTKHRVADAPAQADEIEETYEEEEETNTAGA